MTQINWQYQVNNRAGGYIVTNTDWNDVAGDLRALIDQTTSSTTDNTPLPIGIDLVNDRVYISDPDSTTPEDGNHADTTLSVVGTTTLNGNTQQTGTFTVGVDDTGHDVKFFGATSGSYMLWDESADDLVIVGGSLGVGTGSPAHELHVAGDQPTYQMTSTNAIADSSSTETIADIDWEGQKNALYRTVCRIRARANGTWSTGTADDADSALEFYANNGSGMQGVAKMTGYNVALGISDDRTPDSGGNGQVQIRGNGYTGFIALNGTGMYVGMNASSRNTYLMTDETVALELAGSNQTMTSLATYNSTTAAAADVHVSSVGQFLRESSSIRYKSDVEDMADEYADKVLNLRPVWYRSTANADRSDWSHWGLVSEEVADIDPRLVTYGFTHETDPDTGAIVYDSEPVLDDDGNPTYKQIEGVDENGEPTFTDGDPVTRKTGPRIASLDSDGNPVEVPQGVQYSKIVPLLINIIKRQDARLAALEAAA